jgi:hypothetical protein
MFVVFNFLLRKLSYGYDPEGFCNSLQKVSGKREIWESSVMNNINPLYSTNTNVNRNCLGWCERRLSLFANVNLSKNGLSPEQE